MFERTRSSSCVAGFGLVTSRTTFEWFITSLRAASSRAWCECAAAAPAAFESDAGVDSALSSADQLMPAPRASSISRSSWWLP